MTTPMPVTNPRPRTERRAQGAAVTVDDILVFEARPGGSRLVGGTGRGIGWADVVEVSNAEEPLVSRAWRSGMPVRVSSPSPIRVVGPYWAAHAILVPVSQGHLVVLGNAAPIECSDATAVRMAAQAVSSTSKVPAEKLLADELELVHALRALMAYRPETVRDTARHIASVTANALSCDIGAIQVWRGETGTLEVVRIVDGGPPASTDAGPDAGRYLREASRWAAPSVEQSVELEPNLWAEDVVSRITLPIGAGEPLGAMVLGHAESRPRGFTLLCQRIGRALAESAELLIAQAIAREQLSGERDLMHRASRTDQLTGIGNRATWQDAIDAFETAGAATTPVAILSFDLDGLKAINDAHGHASGDAVLRAAAGTILAGVRSGDTVARVGGDEFLVLLHDASEKDAARVADRIARAAAEWRVTEHLLAPELSSGWASVVGSRIEEAVVLADRRMYEDKALRARRARAVSAGRRRSTASVPAPTSEAAPAGRETPPPNAKTRERRRRRPA